ncbi:hypothetical protein HQ529_06575 [Candidatus Woesearchaeota archaeon]|nr:hypothetical protein [Candidatus Woesearchaeota archaeon]
MNNKRAVELSMNFLVMIIISIAVLTMAIVFSKNLFTSAEEIRLDIDRETNERIESLLDDGSRVVIPFTRKEVRRGDLGIFGVGVLNVVDKTNFTMIVSLDSVFNNDKEDITTEARDNYITIVSANDPVEIDINEKHKFSFGVDMAKKAPSGTYLLDVKVLRENVSTTIPDVFLPYGESAVYKIFVTVP